MNAAAEQTAVKPAKSRGLRPSWLLFFLAGLVLWALHLAFLPLLYTQFGTESVLLAFVVVALLAWSGGRSAGILFALIGHGITVWVLSSRLGVPLKYALQIPTLLVGLLVAVLAGHLRNLQRTLTRQTRELQGLQAEVQKHRESLERQARVDPLTGIYNRQHFCEVFYVEYMRAVRYGEKLSVALLDVDHFRSLNDQHSHVAGDQVLQDIAHILQSSVREMDVVARYGGGGFVLLLPCTPPEAALQLCNRLLSQVSGHMWAHIDPRMQVTLSGGLCSDLTLGSPEAMLGKSEELLQQAKQDGRNQIKK
ncbi:GGDEF domain-containing protein [Deinococcus cellulosilyticus]|uniref:GGDEF domain-containing protein n=1 Tax=Deinococcus cellulosilyticus (strain DSM 18568 / NBRC 106333 / KACC 11606 / 5516J-15) TaxID=1223518 RepID=A0A511N0I6_DEIC1|nr:GGDEF domain-containing protein [Deinococcus cellulosilyticus]GEM46363.1 hypothetical protein DC3_19980 [Deinococcus cellulosilyticus NBRC 106333 = KACC 11606]